MTDVLIIGAGPAGLHAALELKSRGFDALLIEREPAPGGVPRYCGTRTFVCRRRKRILKGPDYARLWVAAVERAGIPTLVETTALRLRSESLSVDITSPRGPSTLAARAILLACGARESHRHQLLVPGDRPAGVFTSGSLYRFLYEQGKLPGRRFVVFHSEDVSYSVVHSIRKAGGEIAGVVEPLEQTRSHPALAWFYQRLRGIPHHFGIADFSIHGADRVMNASFLNGRGQQTHIPCDSVVFTGGFTPNTELAPTAINQCFETKTPGVFAAGNCLRGAVTADEAAWEGRRAAQAIAMRLAQLSASPPHEIPILLAGPLKQVCPQRIALTAPVLARYALWVSTHLRDLSLVARQGPTVLWRKRFARLQPERRIFLPVKDWLPRLETGAPVEITVAAAAWPRNPVLPAGSPR